MRPSTARRRMLAAAVAVSTVVAVVSTASTGAAAPPGDQTAASSLVAPTASDPAGSGPAGSAEAVPGVPQRVTLVTGDVAELETRADGTPRARLVSGSGYHAFVSDGDAYVVPAAAQPLVGRQHLDLALFNVSQLVKQGYDDAHSTVVPLILSYGGTNGLSARTVPAAATKTAALNSIGSVAATTAKSHAGAFWRSIAPQGATKSNAAAVAGLSGGIQKIWLDAKVHSTLDESAAQVGAPAAWSRGFTGKGVKVAVLDTGIDDTHPDFAGRIGATKDFTGKGNVQDGAGHGTHVASITAGTGAASDGKYRGIAPDADLMVGKVLGDDGSGSASELIAGMEWAAANGAAVVNASIGGPVTRGDDPMSEAVDRLTAQYGTLFVVAAGNKDPWVPGMDFVTAPGAADAALTVGAVRTPTSMWGSSRWARMDGTAMKPEIVAPGFGITAAGSSYAGLPQYVSATGTSMATPHVAGAAALLKQQHPDWQAAQLRAALTSTATPFGTDVERRGAGLLNVDRATAQQVYADTGTVHLGYFQRPYGDLTASRTITYHNPTAEAVTLTLSAALDPEASGLTVEPAALTVPAQGTAQAVVKLDAAATPADTYGGRITATAPGLELGTTVAFRKQDDTVDVTFRAIDRDGETGMATIRVSPYTDRDPRYFPDYIYLDAQQPEYTVRLPEGDYNLWSVVLTFDESGRYVEENSIVGDPKLEVRAPNHDVTLDARKAVPITVDTPRPSEPRSLSVGWWRGDTDTAFVTEDTWGWSFIDGSPEKVSVTPTEKVTDAPFVFSASWDSGVTPLTAQWRGRGLDAVQVQGQEPLDGRYLLPVATTGDLRGKAALVRESDDNQTRVQKAVDAGARVVLLYSAQPGVFWPHDVDSPVPVLALPKQQGESLARYRGYVYLNGTPRTPYAYDLTFTENNQVPKSLAYKVKQHDLAEVRTNIYTTGTNERGLRLHQTAADGCQCGPSIVDDFVPSTGYTRTEYVTARPDLKVATAWQFIFGRPADVLYDRAVTAYEPRQQVTENWLKAPLSPGLSQSTLRIGGATQVVKRNGTWLSYGLAGLTDSDGHWLPNFSGMTEASRLYRDGQQVFDSTGLIGGTNVPAEAAAYRLEADTTHDGSRLGLSTSTHTAWTFRSQSAAAEQVLPLIDVDYAGVVDAYSGHDALDLANTARGDRTVKLVLNAAHQLGSQGKAVTKARVRVSYDDGTTWTDASVRSLGSGRFSATYRHPRSGYVSLRVEAGDGDDTVDQTLIKAYKVR